MNNTVGRISGNISGQQTLSGNISGQQTLSGEPKEQVIFIDNGPTYKEITEITGELENLKTTNKTNLVDAINEVKEIGDDAYAYNFTAVGDSMISNSKEARALHYMAHNWQTQAMCLFVKGYPVIALDINYRHIKVLYKDRYIQTFTWEVDGNLTKCRIVPVSIMEMVYKNECEKYINTEISKLKKYVDEAIANNQTQ